METMRALSITMLFAGCGLHAISTSKSTDLGRFVVENYRGPTSKQASDEQDEPEVVMREQCGSNENAISSAEQINAFFAGFENYFAPPYNTVRAPLGEEQIHDNVQQGSVIEINEPVHEQQETTQESCVIKCEPSVMPVIVGIGAAVGVGYAVYKYVTADKKNLKEKKCDKIMMQKNLNKQK